MHEGVDAALAVDRGEDLVDLAALRRVADGVRLVRGRVAVVVEGCAAFVAVGQVEQVYQGACEQALVEAGGWLPAVRRPRI